MMHVSTHCTCQVRQAVDGQAAVLGFVGAPFTLATYIVEGASSKNFHNLKRIAFGTPEVCANACANAYVLVRPSVTVQSRMPIILWRVCESRQHISLNQS